MTHDAQSRGAVAVGTTEGLASWEVLALTLFRLWGRGPEAQARAWNEVRGALPFAEAQELTRAFESLLRALAASAYRPLAVHGSTCECLGADEAVFLHLVRTASEGHLADAALMGSLIAGPAQAEQIALFAGQFGAMARRTGYTAARTRSERPLAPTRLH